MRNDGKVPLIITDNFITFLPKLLLRNTDPHSFKD